jgi:hypothetical protein
VATPTYRDAQAAFEFYQVTQNGANAGDAIVAFNAWVQKLEDAAYNRGYRDASAANS